MTHAVVNMTLPKMDPSSAVFPTARVVGDALVVAYHLPGCESSAVIRFDEVKEWTYGEPNDEGLHQHPLWGQGLTPYAFHEVGPAEGGMLQYVGTFRDGTLAVRASSVEVIRDRVPLKPWAAINAQFGEGTSQILDEPDDPNPRVNYAQTPKHPALKDLILLSLIGTTFGAVLLAWLFWWTLFR